jgi:hypothetical protein
MDGTKQRIHQIDDEIHEPFFTEILFEKGWKMPFAILDKLSDENMTINEYTRGCNCSCRPSYPCCLSLHAALLCSRP